MDTTKRIPARGRAATALAAVLALAFSAGLLVPSSDAQAPDRRDLLPDLQAAVPDHVTLNIVHGHAFVGFDSAVVNRGEGPLEVRGVRASRRERGMRAYQVVTATDGSKADAGGVGALRY